LQLGIDSFNIALWINSSLNMDYIAIVKSSNYLADRITLTDIGKKLITKSCPL